MYGIEKMICLMAQEEICDQENALSHLFNLFFQEPITIEKRLNEHLHCDYQSIKFGAGQLHFVDYQPNQEKRKFGFLLGKPNRDITQLSEDDAVWEYYGSFEADKVYFLSLNELHKEAFKSIYDSPLSEQDYSTNARLLADRFYRYFIETERNRNRLKSVEIKMSYGEISRVKYYEEFANFIKKVQIHLLPHLI